MIDSVRCKLVFVLVDIMVEWKEVMLPWPNSLRLLLILYLMSLLVVERDVP